MIFPTKKHLEHVYTICTEFSMDDPHVPLCVWGQSFVAEAGVLPVVAKRFKRVREFWTQTSIELEERGAQTENMRPIRNWTNITGKTFS